MDTSLQKETPIKSSEDKKSSPVIKTGLKAVLTKPIALIGAAAIIVTGGYFGYKAVTKPKTPHVAPLFKDAKTIVEYNAMDKTSIPSVKLFGQINTLNDNKFYLTQDGSSLIVTNTNNVSLSGFADNDFIVITGTPSSDGTSFNLSKIEHTTSDEVSKYTDQKKPSLAMTILDYTKSAKHGCSTITMRVKLRNSGIVPIVYSKMYGQGVQPLYMIYYSVNGKEWYSFSYDTSSRGYLGFKDFGTIDPGEEKIVEFGGGGNVVQGLDKAMSEAEGKPHPVSTAGNENMLISYEQGKATAGSKTVFFKFAVAQSGYSSVAYAPSFRSESNHISINLENAQCDLTDVLEQKYIGE